MFPFIMSEGQRLRPLSREVGKNKISVYQANHAYQTDIPWSWQDTPSCMDTSINADLGVRKPFLFSLEQCFSTCMS